MCQLILTPRPVESLGALALKVVDQGRASAFVEAAKQVALVDDRGAVVARVAGHADAREPVDIVPALHGFVGRTWGASALIYLSVTDRTSISSHAGTGK